MSSVCLEKKSRFHWPRCVQQCVNVQSLSISSGEPSTLPRSVVAKQHRLRQSVIMERWNDRLGTMVASQFTQVKMPMQASENTCSCDPLLLGNMTMSFIEHAPYTICQQKSAYYCIMQPTEDWSRRQFIQTTTAALASAGVTGPLTSTASASKSAAQPSPDDILRGFIVADAHFGWARKQQPPLEEIERTMQQIMRKFTDLDLFIDAGDSHHSYANHADYQDWCRIIQGGCGTLPFHFVAGNHDLVTAGNHDRPAPQEMGDPEQDVMQLASQTCRPFYSFDLKNIHFVVLPELMVVSLITREAYEWLTLDLELNRDKTVIILSHQSLKGTTLTVKGNPAYRLLANTREMFDLFKKHRNVIAWMHGHNHNWEVVEKHNLLCVSTGRIGGFDPHRDSPLANQLGGVYFEVTPDRFTVRPYSSNNDLWLDTLEGCDHLQQTVQLQTSLDVSAAAAMSYGSGHSLDGQRWPLYHHAVADHVGSQELYFASAGYIINDDPTIQHQVAGNTSHELAIYRIDPDLSEVGTRHDESWEFLNPGIRFHALDDLAIIRAIRTPVAASSRSNWRCPPAATYRVQGEFQIDAAGPTQWFLINVRNHRDELVHSMATEPTALRVGKHPVEFAFTLPRELAEPTIYNDDTIDQTIYVTVNCHLTHLNTPVDVTGIWLTRADAAGETTTKPSLTIDGRTWQRDDALLDERRLIKFNLPQPTQSRQTATIASDGSKTLTWLIRQTHLAWQVRNAAAIRKGNHLEVGPLRNPYSRQDEIIISPLRHIDQPWVHRLRHVNHARLYPFDVENKRLRIELDETFGVAEVDILQMPKPRQVRNAINHEWKDDRLWIISRGGSVVVELD